MKTRSRWMLVLPGLLALGPLRALAAPADDDDEDETEVASADDGSDDEDSEADADEDDEDEDDGAEPGDPPPTDLGVLGSEADWEIGESTGVYRKSVWPLELVKRPVTLARGMFAIRTRMDLDVSAGNRGPVHMGPDFHYGVTDELTVGLSTMSGSGYGVCLGKGCYAAFDEVSLDADYALLKGAVNIAARASLYLGNLSTQRPLVAGAPMGTNREDMVYSAKLGGIIRIKKERIGVTATPGIYIPIDPRPKDAAEIIAVGMAGTVQATPRLALSLVTGIGGPDKKFSKSYQIPFGFQGLFAISRRIDVGAEFLWPNALGKNRSGKVRSLGLVLNVRL